MTVDALFKDVDEVLSTTRAVRRRLDLERPVDRDVVVRCIELAQQAPIAEGQEIARYVVVDDPAQRARVADVYRAAVEEFVLEPLRAREAERVAAGKGPRPVDPGFARIWESAVHLFDRFADVPVSVLVGGLSRRPPVAALGAHASGFYGSVYPSVWSFQLALRSRGLGSSLTCIHLHLAERMAEVLSLPEELRQVALLPVAHTIGDRFRPGPRLPVDDVVHWNRWEG